MKRVTINLLAMVLILSLVAPSATSAAPTPSATDSQSGVAQQIRSTSLQTGPDDPLQPPAFKKTDLDPGEGDPNVRDDWFYSMRIAGDPSANFTMADAAVKRAEAAAALEQQQQTALHSNSVQAFGGTWTAVGPNPMVLSGRGDGTFDAMAGRIGALAVRSTVPYTIYLGGAQGGVWVSSTLTSGWIPKTDQLPSLAIGAIALAPSNEDIVYVGTGEGALSGDSYFGDGVLKSTNGGNTFSKISAAGFFTNVSISKIVVNNTDPNTLYVGTLRGRGGARRTSPPDAAPFAVWKSIDGGVNWTAVLTVSTNPLAFAGVTDLAMDPVNSNVVYATFLGQGISKTVDGGLNWFSVMNGLPAGANYAAAPTRFSLGISRPSAAVSATLYTGFEYYVGATRIPSSVWKSTDDGNTWSATSTAVIGDFCGSQCWYDNVMGVDPISPTIVYALGLYNYNTGSGGIYRSTDGGATWTDIGFNLHPDYHAIAIRKDNPAQIVIGNDGGVWSTSTRGGRLAPTDPLSATNWSNLNGLVDPATAATLARYGLQLGQFTSIATNPTVANRFYGGTQDNGTQRKSTTSQTWFDVASGDGGQVLVDPTDANYVFGTYYGISPYRYTDGGGLYQGGFTSNEYILNGINTNDRSEFYIPWMMDPANSNRLYLGTYRVYRTDNAKAAKSSDVVWRAISPDLTAGCSGAAPNGARGCVIGAFGASAGSPALYVGTLEGYIWRSGDATAASPAWTRIDTNGTLPLRPVASFAVDRSNYRIAYVAFNGFGAATPSIPGHVFKTMNAGQSWTDISSNLPDVPVNSILLDPNHANTLYIGTDVGPLVTHNGGASWSPLGTGFPIITIWQLDLNPFTRQLVAGTHGRGAWLLTDVTTTTLPALQISKSDAGLPVGPGSQVTYSITVKNYGNAAASGVVITDPVPAHTAFVSAGTGGTLVGNNVIWNLTTVPTPTAVSTGGSLGVGLVPGSATVTFTVQITTVGTVQLPGAQIINDGYSVTSAEGASATGSPYVVTLASANGVQLTPANQSDGTRPSQTITYLLSVKNLGFNTDNFDLTTTGNSFPTSLWDAAFATQITRTGNLAPGGLANIGVKVDVPAAAINGASDTVTVTATSTGNSSVVKSATVKTTVAAYNILLVDEDGGSPDVQSYYTATLTTIGALYNYWDLKANPALPLNYMKAHKLIIWFTGASYPDPLGVYENSLAAFLDNGGRLFLSGWDILDQAAGTAPFMQNYLHVAWDGTELQNDKGTGSVTSVPTNTVTAGMGTMAINYAALGLGTSDFSDQVTLIAPARPAFRDTGTGADNALTVAAGNYKVVFLAFPFEAMGTPTDRVTLMMRALDYFAYKTYLPIVMRQ